MTTFAEAPVAIHYEDGYLLQGNDAQQASRNVLTSLVSPQDGRFVCFEAVSTHEVAQIGRGIEAAVFEEKFGNTPQLMAEAYGTYEEASRFFVSFDTLRGRPVGTLRIIEDNPAGFMTVNDLAGGELQTVSGKKLQLSQDELFRQYGISDSKAVWDIGTVAVLPEYRNARAGLQLYRAFYATAMQEGIAHCFSMIDGAAFNQLTRFLHVPFEKISEPLKYMDSKATYPVYGNVANFYDTMDRWRNSIIGRMAARYHPDFSSLMAELMDGTKDANIKNLLLS